jgi:tetratricopeptide (TPR) repeat protein
MAGSLIRPDGFNAPPERVEPLLAAASTALNSGDLAEALRRTDELIRLAPNERHAWLLKARALAAQGRLTDALQVIDEALTLHADDIALLSFARNVALQVSGINDAAQYALRLTAVAPDDLKNELFLADWHIACGEPESALRRLDGLLDKFPNAWRAAMHEARALIALRRGAEALELTSRTFETGVRDLKFLSFARNIALDHGTVLEARRYADAIDAVAPKDQKNRTFLVRACLMLGEFEEALTGADALISDHPTDSSPLVLRAQALLGLHRAGDALRTLKDGLAQSPDDPYLMNLLRNTAYQNGFFEQALEYSLRLNALSTSGEYDKAFLVHAYLATGKFDEVEQLIGPPDRMPEAGPLVKEHYNFWMYKALKRDEPVFASAWELALANRVPETAPAVERPAPSDATMIQYWSQGAPPADVEIVCGTWRTLFARENLGTVELYDRPSAETWIRDYAPEFAGLFSQAFHYAMESDIFRIAYASKRPCIYMDIDSWPLDHTARILRFAVQNKETMLYVRAHRATIVNGFFVSNPESPFIKELTEQCLAIDAGSLPKTYMALENSFGPSRYKKVFTDLLVSNPTSSAAMLEEVPGCSVVTLADGPIYFAHEAAVASVRPPFPLGYKATGDYWKYFDTGR